MIRFLKTVSEKADVVRLFYFGAFILPACNAGKYICLLR